MWIVLRRDESCVLFSSSSTHSLLCTQNSLLRRRMQLARLRISLTHITLAPTDREYTLFNIRALTTRLPKSMCSTQMPSQSKTAGGSWRASSFVLHEGGTAADLHHEQPPEWHSSIVLMLSQSAAPPSTLANLPVVGMHLCDSAQRPTSSIA